MERKRKPHHQTAESDSDSDLDPLSAQKRARTAQDGPGRAGTINRIILKNFMCHSLLDVDLRNNVHILIGQNGSGKSAILTSLIVGLGGKASLTNRGTNIKGFVKVGRNSASVEIRLFNGGARSYRHGVYGNEICVTRTINASGGGSYKVRAENGQVVSTHAKEVQNIVTSLNIQVDNPVCILNQDTSRNFLSTDNPKYKFTLFMKATRLEQLYEEYKTIELNKSKAMRIFSEKQTNLDKLEDEKQNIREKVELHKSVDAIRRNLGEKHRELVWAKVRDAEVELRQDFGEIEALEAKREVVRNKCATRGAKIDQLKDNVKNTEQEIAKIRESVQSKAPVEVKNAIERMRNEMYQKQLAKESAQSKFDAKNRLIRSIEKQISNAGDKISKFEREKKEREDSINSTNEKVQQVNEQIETTKNDFYQLIHDVPHRDDEKQNLLSEITQIEHQINNNRVNLNSMKSDTNSDNNLSLYGREMPKIWQMIEKNRRNFRKLPRGPLGAGIKVKDKKWALAVENCIGVGLLKTFLVDNQDDYKQLMAIFNSVLGENGRKPGIVTTQFYPNRHNVSPNLVEAPNDCLSLIDALDIEDAVIFNCIIDTRSIEGILIVPNNNRACELFSQQENVPRKCTQGITLEGDIYYPDPSYRTYGAQYRRAAFLQVDKKEHVQELERQIVSLQEKKTGKQRMLREISEAISNQNAKKIELDQKIRKLTAVRTSLKRKLDDLESFIEAAVPNVKYLEQELSECQIVAREFEAEFTRCNDELKGLTKELEEKEEKFNQLKSVNHKLNDRIQRLQAQISEFEMQKRELLISEEFDLKSIKEFESKISVTKERSKIKEDLVTNRTEQAAKLGSRVTTNQPVEAILREITKLDREVKKIEHDAEDSGALIAHFNEISQKIATLSGFMISIRNDIDELVNAMSKRKLRCKTVTEYVILLMKHSFKKIMETRQFNATIEVSMQQQTLDLNVAPQNGSQGATSTSNLSGGERSFATAAFLFSLWQCMNAPFYFLDEFDVYMDKMNRTKMTEFLLHYAECHPNSQFVFLTPQDISFVKKKVSILRLENPERRAP